MKQPDLKGLAAHGTPTWKIELTIIINFNLRFKHRNAIVTACLFVEQLQVSEVIVIYLKS